LEVSVINDLTKQPLPVQVIDNEDNTYTVEVTPDAPGTYTTNLNYGGLKVPFNKKTTVTPAVDVSKVQVEGLEQSEFILILLLFFAYFLCEQRTEGALYTYYNFSFIFIFFFV
jgi:Filamin/ABP280 repeat